MENSLAIAPLAQDKIELIKRTIAFGATNDELALFVEQCNRTGLDPFARQIYSVQRKQYDAATRSYIQKQVIQVSIDGFRLIADRTHKYAGQVGPWWCGLDGEWREVWLDDAPPAAAKVGVLRHDFHQPIFSVALYKSYVQTTQNGDPISRWKVDPSGMLAKCAESLALRRAFPQELSGLYTVEEMSNVGETEGAVKVEWKETPPTNGNGKTHAAPAVIEAVEEMREEQAPEEPPTPPPADEPPPNKAMMTKYAALVEQAKDLGLMVADLPANVTAPRLAELGKALKARIATTEETIGAKA